MIDNAWMTQMTTHLYCPINDTIGDVIMTNSFNWLLGQVADY